MREDGRLTREEFEDAIGKGLGRAMVHVKKHGLGEVADLVLDACLHNKVYDTQCEGTRADWLYEMFRGSERYEGFRDAIISALQKENEREDTQQLCKLVKEMAMAGDGTARAALREFALRQAEKRGETDHYGAQEYIQIEGVEGVLELARIYGQRLMEDPEGRVLDYFLCEDEDLIRYAELLREHTNSDPRIRVYVDYLEKRKALKPVKPVSKADRVIRMEDQNREIISHFTAEEVIRYVKSDEKQQWYVCSHFGKYAKPEDLEAIYEELRKATEDEIRKRFLWIFHRTPLPVIHEEFFEWADGNDEPFKAAVFRALSNSIDNRIHDFARQRVRAVKILGWGNSKVLDLFRKNFESSDAGLILDAILASTPDRDDRHDFSLGIIHIVEENKGAEMKDLLHWVYENSPCGMCREDAVEELSEIGALEREMLEECLWDGNGDLREFAKGEMEKIHGSV